MKQKELNNNLTDYIVLYAKAIAGSIPAEHGGSFLSEFLSSVIPGQRMDRLVNFVKILDDKLSSIPIEKVNVFFNNPQFSDIIEEGFYQASRAVTDERRDYISNIIYNSLSEDKINLEKSKFLLITLNQLSDSEIIWLKFYSLFELIEQSTFLEKHKNILQDKHILTTSNEDDFIEVALQKSQKETLERLELIKFDIDIDNKTKQPKLSKGIPMKRNRRVSTFGMVLLKSIGLADTINMYD